MRSMLVVSVLSFCVLSACAAPPVEESAPAASSPEAQVQAVSRRHGHHPGGHLGSQDGLCAEVPPVITQAFADFDAATSPSPLGEDASAVLAPWLAHLASNVSFEPGNASPLVGRAAVASYFAPLLPVMGSVVHDIDTVSPVCGPEHAWSVRGTLLITRRSDGTALPPIPFTDTMFFDDDEDHIVRYEIRFDPTPLNLLFTP